ncbi:hypothetical protein [Pseudomonas oryzihabitans]|uniref:hypothetical protein n=1 Tax=Pseudomonas oryzihabitans TaxID=47885 RepID=UPI002865BD61|nr:hypothetical protein [Pseudomonas psychrotolerans]MDR6676735.1 hypothetical protein [Pseudomonas psychrotolerans]
MSDQRSDAHLGKTPPNEPTVDEAGRPVEVVKKDIQQSESAPTDAIDKAITPTDIKTKEQEADELKRKTAEVERKLER